MGLFLKIFEVFSVGIKLSYWYTRIVLTIKFSRVCSCRFTQKLTTKNFDSFDIPTWNCLRLENLKQSNGIYFYATPNVNCGNFLLETPILFQISFEGYSGEMTYDSYGRRGRFKVEYLEANSDGFRSLASWTPLNGVKHFRNATQMTMESSMTLANKTLTVVTKIVSDYFSSSFKGEIQTFVFYVRIPVQIFQMPSRKWNSKYFGNFFVLLFLIEKFLQCAYFCVPNLRWILAIWLSKLFVEDIFSKKLSKLVLIEYYQEFVMKTFVLHM